MSTVHYFYCTFATVPPIRTNDRSLFANEQSEQWLVTSRGRSPSKLATKKKKLTNRERKRKKNKMHRYT